MRPVAKRVAVVLLSSYLALAPVLEPIAAWAATDDSVTVYDSAVADEITDAAVAADDTAADRLDGETYVSGEDGIATDDLAAALDDSSFAVDKEPADTLSSLDLLEYVYLDQQIVAVGDTQNIAMALKDTATTFTSATIELADETGQTTTADATKLVDNTVLFELPYTEDSQAHSYTIQKVTYTLNADETTYYFDFTRDAEVTYTYEVVKQETADALNNATSEEGVSAIVINEDGTLEAADSVEEALETAGVDTEDEEAGIATQSTITSTRENYLIVAVDPGHGGGDSGACGNGLQEKNLNWSIANYLKSELETYTGVSVYMTRTENECPSLQERVNRAAHVGADVLVSVHINSVDGAPGANGFEILVPNNSSFNNSVSKEANALASKIETQLKKLGLYDRGLKTRNYSTYSDGSTADYYGIIRNARNAGLPGIIVEHAFITNSNDASKLAQDSFRKQLGIADAAGIANQYNIGKASIAKSSALVGVATHVQSLGWENEVYDGKTSGTSGKSKRLEAIKIKLQNQKYSGSIQYKTHVQTYGWQDWVSDGAQAGTSGQSKRLEAIQIKLTGEMANNYDVYYRVHAQTYGWLGWAKNGESAGTSGLSKRLEAIQVVLVAKGSTPSGYDANVAAYKEATPGVSYTTHVQTYGWQGAVQDGATAGTTGQSKRLEAIKLNLTYQKYSGSIQYRTHVQTYGWQDWVSNGAQSGTSGQSKRLEAIQIKLTGEVADNYDIYYRVHAQTYGWLGWAKNGEYAGTATLSKRLEAIQIVLVAKGGAAPGDTSNPFYGTTEDGVIYGTYNIMGTSNATAAQMVKLFNKRSSYPSVYASKGAATINDFCNIVVDEANAEGVRAEVVFAQAMLETGWLKFGGDVKAEQCNFAGIGATGGGVSGNSFTDVRTGIRAQVQHLKAYASTAALKNTCVDPRFKYVTRGSATTVEALAGKWATDSSYGKSLIALIQEVISA